MIKPRSAPLLGGLSVLALSSLLIGQRPNQPAVENDELAVPHAECDYFGPQRERFVSEGVNRSGVNAKGLHSLSATTQQVVRLMARPPSRRRARNGDSDHAPGSLDSFIFADFKKNQITPAEISTDWEFARRVTLDLTGRIPAPDRLLAFTADSASDKRAKLIEELLGKPEWVDKWTMYFGDLYHNTLTRNSTGLGRFAQGRNAFYQYIHDSLAQNKPYNRMAAEMISANATNSYQDGPSNYVLNAYMAGGPAQDTMDLGAIDVFETFLGLGHLNCVMCHNGRGHADTLSLWAGGVTRYQAWQVSAFFAKTALTRNRVDPAVANPYYWSVSENPAANNYALNTNYGNRPNRVAPAGCRSGQPCFYVAPQYIFNGDAPGSGEPYRAALARSVTSDFQFARATVNYMWAYFFGRGLVDPPSLFDPARLDPNNPPPAPWTLQPSNPELLDALAQHFVAGGYDLKALMREIANSETYQLSSRYDGAWQAGWDKYFARKFVRRLWSEEIVDAVSQSSGAAPAYKVDNFPGTLSWVMQLPDLTGPTDTTVRAFLNAFSRGDRDTNARRGETSILQALNIMNSAVVVNRSKTNRVIADNLTKNNTDVVNALFLNILSRFPTPEEMAKAQAAIPAGTGNGTARTTAIQNLTWSLYNKVDFLFNY